MNKMSDTPQAMPGSDERPSPAAPGRRLGEARQAKGLTVNEVANRLCLNVDIIRALEHEERDKLPVATFVAGYLRNYARLLGLPEDEIIEGYGLQPEPPSLIPAVRQRKQIRSSDLPVRLVTYLIILVLLVLLVAWWLSQREEISAEVPEVVTGGGTLELPVLSPESMPTTSNVLEQGVPPAVEPERELAISEGTVGERGSGSAVAESPEETVEAPKPPPLTPETPQSELVLEYSSDCWTEIRDAAGRRLVFALIPAGQRLNLYGEAPFKMFFGYSPGVTIHYNGEFFDHSSYQRQDVARFQLGQTGDNAPLIETDINAPQD